MNHSRKPYIYSMVTLSVIVLGIKQCNEKGVSPIYKQESHEKAPE